MAERVYFIAARRLARVKIGYTAQSIEKRLCELQVGSPDDLVLLGHIQGGRHVEDELHRRFRGDHLRGEWFSLSGNIIRFLRQRHIRIPQGLGEQSTHDDRLQRIVTSAADDRHGGHALHQFMEELTYLGRLGADLLDQGDRDADRVIRHLEELAAMALAWANDLDPDIEYAHDVAFHVVSAIGTTGVA